MDKRNIFLGVFLILAVVLSLYFVLAAAKAPTVLVAGLNTTANYDKDGTFYINWTNNSLLDSAFNIYITTNGSGTSLSGFVGAVMKKVANDSGSGNYANNPNAHGYRFSNVTNANYTFIVEAKNATGTATNSTEHVSITVDTIGPTSKIYSSLTPSYSATNTTLVNASASNRAYTTSTSLILNIYVADASSGLTDSMCLVSINASNPINQSILAVTNGWCNSTSVDLSGNTDGTRRLQVYVNDTLDTFALNNTIYIEMDSTNPTASASCSPSLVIAGASFPCSCTRADVTSGVNTSKNSQSSSSGDGISSPVLTGTFTYTCGATDYAGNTDSDDATYTVEGSGSGGGTSGNGEGITWTTHQITQAQFQEGYTSQIQANKRIRVQVGGQDHHVGVVSLTATQATIEISSDPVQVTLDVGEDAKVDVTDDGFYDIYVILNDIVDNKADVTIQEIHEEIPEGEDGVTTTGDVEGEEEEPEETKSLLWLWILIAVVVIVVIIGGGVARAKKKKQ